MTKSNLAEKRTYENRKDYMREYQLKWIKSRRKEYLAEYGPCLFCGTTEKLETHHVDPKKKNTHRIWSLTDKKIRAELKQCVILCAGCHDKFHALLRKRPLVHGTIYAYQHYRCRCPLCRKAKSNERKYYGTGKKYEPGQLELFGT